MLRLPLKLIAFVFCFLFVSPQAHACRGAFLEDTLFFNANDQPLFVDNLGQKPPDIKGLVKLPPDVDVIAEVILTGANSAQFRIPTVANIVRIIQTSDARVRQGAEIPIKFKFTSCGPNHRNGDSGIIAAKIGTDIEDRLVLCPYSRNFSDGRITSPIGSKYISECNPSEIETPRQIKHAAENGDMKAQIALALMYEKGKSVRQDNAEAVKWFHLAVKSEDAEAQFEFGRKYQRDENGKEALKWLELAAAQGHAEAMYSIGWMYEYGNFGIKHSEAEAVKWYTRAAEHGNTQAKPKVEIFKKMESLKLAVKKGDAEAQYDLGKMYRRRDDTGALKWLTLAAAQRNVRAINELGDMYRVGSGVTKNYGEAVKWYQLGAEQGYAESQVNLGQMYRVYDGEICGKQTHSCLRNAVVWYRRAADQGNSRAQYFLGRMYQEGDGVKKNDTEAVKWYRLAAEQGEGLAKDFLTQMYLQGRGIDENDAEAVKWLRQATKNGNERAKAVLEALKK